MHLSSDELYWLQRDVAVVGVDEAGRGALAGPMHAAAVVVLPEHRIVESVKDSKQMTPRRREALAVKIASAHLFAVRAVGPGYIDRYGIELANTTVMLRAVTSAVEQLGMPFVIFVDGRMRSELHATGAIEVVSGSRGDSRWYSVAAASVLAKTARDRVMQAAASLFPEFGFASNKGYGTKQHRAAIEAHGLCRIHRRSFLTSAAPLV